MHNTSQRSPGVSLEGSIQRTTQRAPKSPSRVVAYLEALLDRQYKRQRTYDWSTKARPNQLPPPAQHRVAGVRWYAWLILAGRGFGKTRTGAETIRCWVKERSYKRVAFIGSSAAEIRHVMLEGESGLITLSPPHEKPVYADGKSTIKWPNGAMGYLINGNLPEKLRGFQFDAAWIDELAKFRDPQHLWDMLQMCLRLGKHPRTIITTTPKPCPFLKRLTSLPGVAVTTGSTFDNTENLAPGFIDQMKASYANTTLGLQELYAHLLTDTQGALWRRSQIKYLS